MQSLPGKCFTVKLLKELEVLLRESLKHQDGMLQTVLIDLLTVKFAKSIKQHFEPLKPVVEEFSASAGGSITNVDDDGNTTGVYDNVAQIIGGGKLGNSNNNGQFIATPRGGGRMYGTRF